jgi:hypothetical protein
VANSFFSNVNSSGRTSVVTYFAQLQSTGDSIRYAVTFDQRRQLRPLATEAQTGTPEATLASYQQVTITLGKQAFSNASGTGWLGQPDIGRFTTVNCTR